MLKWTVTKRAEGGGTTAALHRKQSTGAGHARRSLGALNDRKLHSDGITAASKVKARRSLGATMHRHAHVDKENQCVTSTPHHIAGGRRSLASPYSTALRDVSNITPDTTPRRLSSTPQSRKRAFPTSPTAVTSTAKKDPNNLQYASTLPTFDIEYSPCGVKNVPFLSIRGLGLGDSYFDNPGRYFHEDQPAPKRHKTFLAPAAPPAEKSEPSLTPLSSRLSELRFSKISFKRNAEPKTLNNNQIFNDEESSLNSSEMGDITLDKMIDAILESAKKDRLVPSRPKRSSSVKSKQSNLSPTYTPAEDPAADLYKDTLIERLPPKLIEHAETTIILEEPASNVNEREVKTPEVVKPPTKHFRESLSRFVLASPLDACHLRRQKAVRRKNKAELNEVCEKKPCRIGLTIPNGIPSPETPQNPNFTESKLDQLAQMQTPSDLAIIVDSDLPQTKTALSTIEEMTPSIRSIDLQGTSTPTGNEALSFEKSRKCLTFSPNLSEDSLEKRRSVASSTTSRCSRVPTMVKGSLDLSLQLAPDADKLHVHVIRCKDLHRSTAATGASTINAYVKIALVNPAATGAEQGFQRTAVHRNSNRPLFDQRFVFDLGSSEVSEEDDQRRVQLAVWHRDRECKRSEFLGCMSFPLRNAIKQQEINGSFKLQPQSCLTNPAPPQPIGTDMCENSQSSVDEIVSVEETGPGCPGQTVSVTVVSSSSQPTEPISLSKKALHQRDADENLFLRFLELDPPLETSGNGSTAAAGNTGGGSGTVPATPRRSSICSNKPNPGRTPFTITKRLTRVADKGFGFSIVWTHPPRVEKVEPGLSAEKAGILPGDYVVFVDKHNVVTMPELDVLNLIKTQGNTLLLEIFRRPQRPPTTNGLRPGSTGAVSTSNLINFAPYSAQVNFQQQQQQVQQLQQLPLQHQLLDEEPSLKPSIVPARSSTACSNISIETAKRKLNLPQVTFSKESILQQLPDDHRRKFLYQLISREQHFVTAINFGIDRFVNPLRDRKDLISPNDHKTLFQNIDELSRISEDILEQIIQDESEPQIHFASRVYLSKCTALCAAYKKYCNGLKKADCVLVNKSRNTSCDFMRFITEPPVPRRRPDLTTFIHRPLQHFREILKLVQMIASHCRVDSEEHNNLNSVINELQAAYREITVGGGLMEPIGEGRPLLTLQDLEARMVFTKCKPFQLASHGRQWIFGGDLSRVEGRSVKPYWTLLFSDILLFAKVSRDRVLFITEEPIALSTITDSCFNVRKKNTEFRITIDPNGRAQLESPTVHCAPDLTRTPKKNSKKRCIILRAPSTELKAVWQNLLTRQIFLVNATFGATPLSSPLDSPDILQTLLPMGDIGTTAASMASVKVPSLDSIHLKNQQLRSSKVPRQVEELIDEKCRSLNKSGGVPKGSALHLAQWMKGQLDKQVVESDPIDSDPEQTIEEWSIEQVANRSKELKLVDKDGNLCATQPAISPTGGGCLMNGGIGLGLDGGGSGSLGGSNSKLGDAGAGSTAGGDALLEDGSTYDGDDDNRSVSKSTTSDSQITVRSSPLSNKVDTISVCRQCHKNCKSRMNSPSSNSLTVQHSQTSSTRCCVSASTTGSSLNKSPSSISSTSTLTIPSKSPTKGDEEGDLTAASVSAESGSTDQPDSAMSSPHVPQPLNISNSNYKTKCQTPCHCKCTPKDFEKTTISPDEVLHERVRILKNISEMNANTTMGNTNLVNGFSSGELRTSRWEPLDDNSNIEDWSLMLIGLAQINPAASLVRLDPFEAVPTIAVVPPTPDALNNSAAKHGMSLNWSDSNRLQLGNISESNGLVVGGDGDEYSPDNSPEDELPEPPYRVLNTGMKRYGTMSSLERVPSDETDDKTYNSSEDDEEENDIKIVTKEVYDTSTQPFMNWTARAGSFIEESRAFIDRYLGRGNSNEDAPKDEINSPPGDEGETSVTSGEEVWGTPTSGGENDDLQIFGSIEQTHSSPTKSTSSYTGDDDTELMMDELLMAPPMTASAVRGLLPRRKLEPLFEEDSESCESEDDDNDSKPLSGHDKQGQAVERNRPRPDYVDLKDSTESDSRSITSSSTPMAEDDLDLTVPAVPETLKTTTPDENYGSAADRCSVSALPRSIGMHSVSGIDRSGALTSFGAVANQSQQGPPILTLPPPPSTAPPPSLLYGMSPRLEMRLALNHDILGDEDLMGNPPTVTAGQDLTTILGPDLSTYHRMSGRDIIMNRVIPRVNSYSSIPAVVAAATNDHNKQLRNGTSSSYLQNNSKMDTPTPNRRKQQLEEVAQAQLSHTATWNSFGSVDREKTLSDLERLARREKVYCMTQLNQNGSHLKHTASFQKSKTSKLFKFLSRRNSENQLYECASSSSSVVSSRASTLIDGNYGDDVPTISSSQSDSSRMNSPRKENDKSMDRRFWKQLNKRRRNSLHELTAGET
ncbi:uncharacterized protein LOC129746143 isoform X2 [Uranotaenia lowii]|uniref:uncharacterized protein LOC129746143 isoform X2 n=1 Tax=Uranotaenia lowii TaxID=190385 RepID=UPI0024785047|nr:uncharacterized protein LOC129746143 isoform X2 [Uranotaenia lowii]